MQPPSTTTKRNHRTMPWLAGGLVVLLGIAAVVLSVYPAWGGLFYFHPASDALWRALPAQCVHLNMPHLIMNLAVLLGAAAVAAHLQGLNHLPGALLVSALAVGGGLQWETPPLAWYVGLSGALYGVFVWLALMVACQTESWRLKLAAFVIGAGVGLKAWLGIGAGALLAGAHVAQSAHLYGYLGGLCFACCTALFAHYQRWRTRPE